MTAPRNTLSSSLVDGTSLDHSEDDGVEGGGLFGLTEIKIKEKIPHETVPEIPQGNIQTKLVASVFLNHLFFYFL